MTSLLLVFPHAIRDHQQAVLDYFSTQPQLAAEFLPKIHPDCLWYNTANEGISIEMVRDLIAESTFAPYQAPHRWVVLCTFESASLPAQNALLKILEEPPTHTHIVLTTSSLSSILETIQSRCRIVSVQAVTSAQDTSADLTKIWQVMTTASPAAAITLAAEYKERPQAIELVEQCLVSWHQRHQLHPSPGSTQLLRSCNQALTQLHQNANVTLVLEDWLFTSQRLAAAMGDW